MEYFIPVCLFTCFTFPLLTFTDRKSGKGKVRIDDEDIIFQRMVAKVSQLTLSLLSLLGFELGNQV